jgi:hypothetical protein
LNSLGQSLLAASLANDVIVTNTLTHITPTHFLFAGEQRGLEHYMASLSNVPAATLQRCLLPNRMLLPAVLTHLLPLRSSAACRLPGTAWAGWAPHLRPVDSCLDTAGLLLEEFKEPQLCLALAVRPARAGERSHQPPLLRCTTGASASAVCE